MNFEALQAVRESCRTYSDKPVSRETLTHLVDVARMCPDGYWDGSHGIML